MALTTLNQLVTDLESQASWQGQQQFKKLLMHWSEIVGTAVSQHTRPLDIQRNVLQVATSSAVWAQNLAFERPRIVQKLNDRLSLSLKDIRFSTAHWHADRDRLPPLSEEIATLWQNHPSQVAPASETQRSPISKRQISAPQISASQTSERPTKDLPKDPQVAFLNWARQMRSLAHTLPLCPSCSCPTPTGELERWGICALCAAQQFH
jgi:predicted nucleic acid-binding Zn ribbon protein